MNNIPSKGALLKGLKSFAEEVEGTPTVRGMRQDGPYSPHYYKERFGSWHNALRAANIQPTHGIHTDVDREKLIDELKRINGMTEGTPRRRDVDEHGKYDYNRYVDEFESFVLALEEAGIDPNEKQYRFSSIETPERKKGSENLQKLREEGPMTATELPQGRSTADRRNGVWKFTVSSGSTNPSNPIYYLNGEHAPELVIRRFFQQNPHVLEYRTPHGIKQHISNHKPSWGEIGQDIVDQLVEDGVAPESKFENLVLIRTDVDETLDFCFDRTIVSPVQMERLPLDDEYNNRRPVWGFPQEYRDSWQALSEMDGLLFSTKPGVFTHYVPIHSTVENSNIMTELWIEYEDGVRSGGISEPWPFLAIGEEVREATIWKEEIEEEVDVSIDGKSVQHLTEKDMSPLLNSYGGFLPFLRARGRSDDTILGSLEFDENFTVEEIVDLLFEITEEDLPNEAVESDLEKVERKTREDAFRKGIHDIYSECAICGELFESPEGSDNLEAAHILPKSNGGPDLLQNGLGLCSRHHWAFDHDWFNIGENYEIRVRDCSGLEGFETLQQYDGSQLKLPSDEDVHPHPHYLRQRNQQ